MQQRIFLVFLGTIVLVSSLHNRSPQSLSFAQSSTTVTVTSSPSATATTSPIFKVYINEIAPHPLTTATPEYIELFNASEQTITTQGLYIDDDPLGGSPPFFLPEATILPQGFHLIQDSVSLNNTGDTIILGEITGGELDRYVYGLTAPSQVFGRYPDGETWILTIPGSPGEANIAPPSTFTATETMLPPTMTPIATSTTIIASATPVQPTTLLIISEVLPAPAGKIDWDGDGVANGDDELVELCNTSSTTQSLIGLLLDDGEGGSTPFSLPSTETINPFACHLFFRRDTKIVLNNTEDTVRFLSSIDGRIIDSMHFSTTNPDISWQRQGTQWLESRNPSPGRVNEQSVTTSTPSFPLTGQWSWSMF